MHFYIRDEMEIKAYLRVLQEGEGVKIGCVIGGIATTPLIHLPQNSSKSFEFEPYMGCKWDNTTKTPY